MTVGEQLLEGILAHRDLARGAAREEALAMLRAVGIAEPERRLAQYPFELSGGMCQRVMIAIALASRPAVVIADEPTTALDVTIQAQILDLMKAVCARDPALTILLITHDMGVVADMADRVAVMYAGRIVEIGAGRCDIRAARAHPYTRPAARRAVPRLDGAPKARLAMIEGNVPDIGDWPAGCRFAPRCPLAAELLSRASRRWPPIGPVGPPPAGTPIGSGRSRVSAAARRARRCACISRSAAEHSRPPARRRSGCRRRRLSTVAAGETLGAGRRERLRQDDAGNAILRHAARRPAARESSRASTWRAPNRPSGRRAPARADRSSRIPMPRSIRA